MVAAGVVFYVLLAIFPGLVILLWIVGSALFSWYVSSFGSYNETYGSLGAIIILFQPQPFWASGALTSPIPGEVRPESAEFSFFPAA